MKPQSRAYRALVDCFDERRLALWIQTATVIHAEGTDQEEHVWSPDAKQAIQDVFSDLLEFGAATFEFKLKQCTRCKAHKERSEFSRNKRQKDGLQIYCKACNKRVAMNALDSLLACKSYDDLDAWFEVNTVDDVLTDEAVAALNHVSKLGTELAIMINSSYAW